MGQREDPPEWWPWDWERCHPPPGCHTGTVPRLVAWGKPPSPRLLMSNQRVRSVGFCMCAAGHEAEGQVFQKKQNFSFCGVISKGQHVWREIRLVVEMAECPYPTSVFFLFLRKRT